MSRNWTNFGDCVFFLTEILFVKNSTPAEFAYFWQYTVFIRKSAQPQISAHLE